MVGFYYHGTSANHGCEAIVRSTSKMLEQRPLLFSGEPDVDRSYQLHAVADVFSHRAFKRTFFEKVRTAFSTRLLKSDQGWYDVLAAHEAADIPCGSVAMSIGGDNYCYGKADAMHLAALNCALHKCGAKTVLWGCSINPDSVDKDMKKDFARYDLIVARESISYDFLKAINPDTMYACDPAFSLEKRDVALPEGFALGKTVGINMSPLVQKSETDAGIAMANYEQLVQHIIEDTDYHIAFIPHVVQEGNDDRVPLQHLYDLVKHTGRACIIPDCDCRYLKGYISQCSMFIGARTHATIAAYSTGVPTLVIGYSTKAIGIARDLFGSEEHYVLPVQSLREPGELSAAFDWLNAHKEEATGRLARVLPDYIATLDEAVAAVKELADDDLSENVPQFANKRLCTGCSACVHACPKGCLEMQADEHGFAFSRMVAPMACIKCRKCELVCPATHPEKPYDASGAYALRAHDEGLRMASSSGAAFSLLALDILKQGGAVYGAAYDKEYRVRHFRIETAEDLAKLCGAKYSQSDLGDSFFQVKADLESGKKVLFSGTPCQIAGLHAYLGEDSSNLLLVDFVCHGVPSPLAWKGYVSYRSRIDAQGVQPLLVNMRSKRTGWSRYKYSTLFEYDGNVCATTLSDEDLFMKLFVGDAICRESCANCPSKGFARMSDITLGDFWGVWDICPAMDDDKGTSLVIPHTATGLRALGEIAEQVDIVEVQLSEAVAFNPSLVSSSPASMKRDKVLPLVCAGEFDKAALL